MSLLLPWRVARGPGGVHKHPSQDTYRSSYGDVVTVTVHLTQQLAGRAGLLTQLNALSP